MHRCQLYSGNQSRISMLLGHCTLLCRRQTGSLYLLMDSTKYLLNIQVERHWLESKARTPWSIKEIWIRIKGLLLAPALPDERKAFLYKFKMEDKLQMESSLWGPLVARSNIDWGQGCHMSHWCWHNDVNTHSVIGETVKQIFLTSAVLYAIGFYWIVLT